jgi:hypothetical protein
LQLRPRRGKIPTKQGTCLPQWCLTFWELLPFVALAAKTGGAERWLLCLTWHASYPGLRTKPRL